MEKQTFLRAEQEERHTTTAYCLAETIDTKSHYPSRFGAAVLSLPKDAIHFVNILYFHFQTSHMKFQTSHTIF